MKLKSLPLRYSLFTFRLDQLWFPTAIWALFALVTWFLRDNNASDAAVGFLGVTLPLISGILAAYAFLDDPALELTFATPYPSWRLLAGRLGILLGVDLLCAITFQIFCSILGVNLSGYGDLLALQMLWLVPCFVLTALGCWISFLMAEPAPGALTIGLLWIVQILIRGWFISSPWGQYFFPFMGVFAPQLGHLLATQIFLIGLSLVFLAAVWYLIKKQERYL